MDESEIQNICKTRLESWANILKEHHCTPGILIGIGHDHVSGQIRLIIPEGWPTDQAITILAGTLSLLRKNKIARN